MSRKSTGTVAWRPNPDRPGTSCWHARYTRGDGTRTPWRALDPNIPEDDRARAEACALQFVGDAKALTKDGKGETVAHYAKRWLDDREGRVHSLDTDRSRMRDHVLTVLGSFSVLTFTRDDVERLRDDLDGKIVSGALAWKTAASAWSLVTSMCSDMVNAKRRDLRARGDNPAAGVLPPERGERKAKQYLYPSEFLRFISCDGSDDRDEVPLRLRRAVAISVYMVVRDGELRALRWDGGDIDLEHGTLSVTRSLARSGATKSTKSGETRRFAIERELLPLLKGMHDESKGKGPVVSFRDRHMSRDLRLWLKRAGVTRPELHEGNATRKPITWHDLRATGITWMAVRGDDPLKIRQRAGHSTLSTTELYIREAEAIRDGFGEVFPSLPAGPLAIVTDLSVTIQHSRNGQKQAVSGGGAGNRTLPESMPQRLRMTRFSRTPESSRRPKSLQSSTLRAKPSRSERPNPNRRPTRNSTRCTSRRSVTAGTRTPTNCVPSGGPGDMFGPE